MRQRESMRTRSGSRMDVEGSIVPKKIVGDDSPQRTTGERR